MRYKLFFFALLCSVLVSCRELPTLPAPPPGTLVFGEDRDEVASDILAMDDGNFLILGGKEDKKSSTWDIMLIKVTPDGTELWTRIIEDDSRDSYGRHIVKIDDGYAIVAYEVANNNGNFYGGVNAFLERYDDDFQLQGRSAISAVSGYGGTADPVAEMHPTASGGALVEVFNYDQINIQAFAPNGNPQEPINFYSGSQGAQRAKSLAPDLDGGFILGLVESYGSNRLTLQYLDGDGAQTNNFQDYVLDETGQVVGIAALPDSTILVSLWTYEYYSSSNPSGASLAHLDRNGNVIRQVVIDNQAYFTDIFVHSDSSILLFGNSDGIYDYSTGVQTSQVVVNRISDWTSDGEISTFGGDASGMRGVVPMDDDRYGIVGFTRSFGAGGSDATLIFYQP